MQRITALVFILVMAGPALADKQEKQRAKIVAMSEEVLADLYELKPETKKMVRDAEGYAVFSNVGINLVLLSAGGGRGVVVDNDNGSRTFMDMGTAGVGIGLGVKDFRGVFIFHSRKAMTNFINHGWDFSGQADAAAKSGDKGAEGNLAATAVNGVSLYQMTRAGLALQATLQGTKYWRNRKLNGDR